MKDFRVLDIKEPIVESTFYKLLCMLDGLNHQHVLVIRFKSLQGYPHWGKLMAVTLLEAKCVTIGIGIQHVHAASLYPYTACNFSACLPSTTFLPQIEEYWADPETERKYYGMVLRPGARIDEMFQRQEYLFPDEAKELGIVKNDLKQIRQVLPWWMDIAA